MYKAKIMIWTKKLATAEQDNKARKVAYYRRLLTMYPPVPSGHTILRDYIDALTAEYKNGEEGMVSAWIESTDEKTFEECGTTKSIFDEWQNTSESLVKNKCITIGELKIAWGVNKKPEKLNMPQEKEEMVVEEEPEPEKESKPSEPAPGVPVGTVVGQQQQMGMAPQMQSQMGMAPQMMNPMMTNPMMMHRQPSAHQMMVNQFGQFGQQQAMVQSITTTQNTYQQTIIQQPPVMMGGARPMQKMAAVVPWGTYGGMQMTVNTPQGRMRVTVPPGYGPGSTFTFNVPQAGGLYA